MIASIQKLQSSLHNPNACVRMMIKRYLHTGQTATTYLHGHGRLCP
jgi:hypothetical protein